MATRTEYVRKHGMMDWSTRDLMVLAAISLVFGLLLTGMTYVVALMSGLMTLTVSSAIFGGIWLLPAFMTSYIIRRPGTALLTSVLYTLVQVPFSPYGLSLMIGGIIGGLIYELPFLITRYRSYGLPTLIIGGGLANLGTVFVHMLMGGVLNISPVLIIIIVLVSLVSGALGGWLAKLLTDTLARSGLFSGTAVGVAHTDEVDV